MDKILIVMGFIFIILVINGLSGMFYWILIEVLFVIDLLEYLVVIGLLVVVLEIV